MKKPVKIVLAVLGGLVALFVLAVALVLFLVDPNDFKPQISQAVHDATGRELTFEGDISLNFFPWFELELGPLALSNAQGFEEKDMLSIKGASLDVHVLPLLSKKLEAGMITVEGLTVHLAKDAQGKGNWEDLAGGGKPAEPAESAEPAAEKKDSGGGGGLAGIDIKGVQIKDATLTYADASTGQDFRLTGLNMTAEGVNPSKPFALHVDFGFSSAEPQLDSRLNLDCQATVDPSAPAVALKGLALKIDASGKAVPGGKATVTADGDMSVDMAKGVASIPSLVLGAYNLKVQTKIEAKGLPAEPSFDGEITLPSFSARELLQQMGMPLETSDPKAMADISAQLAFAGDTKRVATRKLALKLDDTTVDGSAEVQYVPSIVAKASLDIGELNVDRYLPPQKAQATQDKPAEPAEKTAEAAPAQEPDLSGLRTLDVEFALNMAKLIASKLTITDIALRASAKQGLLGLDSLTANLYQGALQTNATLDARQDVALLGFKTSLQHLQAGPMVHDLAGKDIIDGTAKLNADITAKGLTPDALKQSLNGKANFFFADGAIYGINIPKMLREAEAFLTGDTTADTGPNKTDFAELSGSAVITNGLVSNKDLLLKSPLLRVDGKGTADLPKEVVNYLVTAEIVGSLEGQGGKSNLSGVPVPIRVSGTFQKPSFAVDTEELGKRLITGKAEETLTDMATGLLGGDTKTKDGKSGTKTKSKDKSDGLGSVLKGLGF